MKLGNWVRDGSQNLISQCRMFKGTNSTQGNMSTSMHSYCLKGYKDNQKEYILSIQPFLLQVCVSRKSEREDRTLTSTFWGNHMYKVVDSYIVPSFLLYIFPKVKYWWENECDKSYVSNWESIAVYTKHTTSIPKIIKDKEISHKLGIVILNYPQR